jgi:predicted amidophosphoribosyltransferase
MTRFPCTLCGSRDWPRENAGCPLCEMPEPDDEVCPTCGETILYRAGLICPQCDEESPPIE